MSKPVPKHHFHKLPKRIRTVVIDYSVWRTPDAIIYHHRPNSFGQFMKMMFRYGFGHAQIVKKHGLCQKIHWMPIMFVSAILYIVGEATRVWPQSIEWELC